MVNQGQLFAKNNKAYTNSTTHTKNMKEKKMKYAAKRL